MSCLLRIKRNPLFYVYAMGMHVLYVSERVCCLPMLERADDSFQLQIVSTRNCIEATCIKWLDSIYPAYATEVENDFFSALFGIKRGNEPIANTQNFRFLFVRPSINRKLRIIFEKSNIFK